MDRLREQAAVIDRVARSLQAGGAEVVQFETHVSRVLVAGGHAFKFKKALRLPFLDDATLDARRFHCEEECRLNRRLAPDLYLDVVPVTGDIAHPVLGGTGEPIEYAVRMHAFAQQALWGFRLAHALLDGGEVDQLAHLLARFHVDADRAPVDSGWGGVDTVAETFSATLGALSVLAIDGGSAEHLSALRQWEAAERARLDGRFRLRKAQGMIRECHGDLHCDNVLTAGGRVQAFDCIEFSDSLRWIDVMDDLAFICMDLACRGRPDCAARLLNRYLESTGDYAGLAVLPYYRVHRALVRARVMLLRAAQRDIALRDRQRCREAGLSYLACAHRFTRPGGVAIMVTHGYSGSGKTMFCRFLVDIVGAVQLRSDVERKRLHAGRELTDLTASCGTSLYGAAATGRTYGKLRSLAREIAAAGWPVIVDAACLMATQRASFHALAADMGVAFFLFDIRASHATMSERIRSRQHGGLDASDADMAVLERQIAGDEPLGPEELADAIVVDTEPGLDMERVRQACAPVLAILGTPG
jgi:aminoglycoside phosphotransferase family enzyme/predicted kinase